MKLIVGGYAQGKLDYVKKHYRLGDAIMIDGCADDTVLLDRRIDDKKTYDGREVIFYHFHRWVKTCIEQGECPEERIREFLRECDNCIIISDEVGNGIVPMEASEREYRERLGRILIELAGSAKEVVRVICGVGQRIK